VISLKIETVTKLSATFLLDGGSAIRLDILRTTSVDWQKISSTDTAINTFSGRAVGQHAPCVGVLHTTIVELRDHTPIMKCKV